MAFPVFTIEGRRVAEVGRSCLLRLDDRMVGRCNPHRRPESLDQVLWYTIGAIARRAGVTPAIIEARLKDNWGFADLIKPLGWERLVTARRHGLLIHGKTVSLREAARKYRVTLGGLERRLANPQWSIEQALAPGRVTRTELAPNQRPPLGVPVAPPVGGKLNAKGVPASMRSRFFFRGAVDTLPGHAKAHGMSIHTVRDRLRKGMSLEQAFDPRRKPRSDRGVPNPRRSLPRTESSMLNRMRQELGLPEYDGDSRQRLQPIHVPRPEPAAPAPTQSSMTAAPAPVDAFWDDLEAGKPVSALTN